MVGFGGRCGTGTDCRLYFDRSYADPADIVRRVLNGEAIDEIEAMYATRLVAFAVGALSDVVSGRLRRQPFCVGSTVG